MTRTLDNTALWNEAAKSGALLGAVSVGCLALKELAATSGSTLLVQAAGILLWAAEFFGCILLMKKQMLDLRDRYQDVRMADTFRLGKRAALLSGLLLASAQALFILKMPDTEMAALADSVMAAMPSGLNRDQVEGALDKLPVFTFIFQWIYCYLYGTVLASMLSRYIFMQKLFKRPEDDSQTPDEQ